jgi:hypothetical protein
MTPCRRSAAPGEGSEQLEFERPDNKPFPKRAQPFADNRASCFGCHQYPGIYSFNSFHGDFPFTVRKRFENGGDGKNVVRPHALAPLPVEEVERAAIKWRESQPARKALRKLWAE